MKATYFPNVFPTYAYRKDHPTGKRFDTMSEFEAADDGRWVDTPAKIDSVDVNQKDDSGGDENDVDGMTKKELVAYLGIDVRDAAKMKKDELVAMVRQSMSNAGADTNGGSNHPDEQ